nr:MAG TPA: hypothetical protein [Caudoviricetes sp.]
MFPKLRGSVPKLRGSVPRFVVKVACSKAFRAVIFS